MSTNATQRALQINAVIKRIQDRKKLDEQKHAEIKAKQVQELFRNLSDFMGISNVLPTEIFYEGVATRNLLKEVGCNITFYHQNDSTGFFKFLLNGSSELVRVPVDEREDERECNEEKIAIDQVLQILSKDNATWEHIIANIHTEVDKIMARVGEDGSVSERNTSKPEAFLRKFYTVTALCREFVFSVPVGYGLVEILGWYHLISFNCPPERASCACEGMAISVTVAEIEEIRKTKRYHGLPVRLPLPL